MKRRCKLCGGKVQSRDSIYCSACEDEIIARKYKRRLNGRDIDRNS